VAQAEPLILHQLAALHLIRAGGAGPGVQAVLGRLAAYTQRLSDGLARGAGAGWLGGITCRPDVFHTLSRYLLAVAASPPPHPPADELRRLLDPLATAPGRPPHPLLTAALHSIAALQPVPSPAGPARASTAAGGAMFLLSGAA
jgi:hypothetical protein